MGGLARLAGLPAAVRGARSQGVQDGGVPWVVYQMVVQGGVHTRCREEVYTRQGSRARYTTMGRVVLPS